MLGRSPTELKETSVIRVLTSYCYNIMNETQQWSDTEHSHASLVNIKKQGVVISMRLSSSRRMLTCSGLKSVGI